MARTSITISAVSHTRHVPILPLDLAPVEDTKINRSAVERRAVTMLNDIERQLEHFTYGRYASMQYQALG